MVGQRRILVIGAGASGLAAIKSCKEEALDVICYEKTKHYGGRWRYTEQHIPRTASIMKSTICISSKEMEAYSDFPPPSDFPNFLHNTKMLAYLSLYAKKFDLIRHIFYQREVLRITPSSEYDKNGKWSVTSLNKYNNSESTKEFDCVMVCTGRQSEPFSPQFPNQDMFNGIKLHSQSLKSTKDFEDLKILVVGNGNSAVDAAVEISTVANQVYLSTRAGFWLFPKSGPKGLPYDMQILRRDVQWLKGMCSDFVNKYIEGYLNTKINHDVCKIKPLFRALDKPPTVNDDLPDKILTGRIIIKGNVSRFDKNGVIFDYEEGVTEVDGVIFATGYCMKLPFIDEDIYINKDGSSNLYKYVFPVGMEHPTLAFIGFLKSNGPQIPIAESQCRWAARLFSGKINLPSKKSMEAYIASKSSSMNSHEIIVDYIDYMDEIAEEYGVKPNMCSLMFKDSKLFWAIFTGPFLSYQYRLFGPNKLENARDFILTYEQRVNDPFNTTRLNKSVA